MIVGEIRRSLKEATASIRRQEAAAAQRERSATNAAAAESGCLEDRLRREVRDSNAEIERLRRELALWEEQYQAQLGGGFAFLSFTMSLR